MSAIKIVIIGIGLIGREHCALVQKHPHAKLVGISDISPDAKQYAEKLEFPIIQILRSCSKKSNPMVLSLLCLTHCMFLWV